MFKNIVFDLKSPLKWSFYFIDNDKMQLKRLYEELKDHDYKIEKLEKNDQNEWVLKVSKVDILTADKLYRRNVAFNELAEFCDVQLYDGWEVEENV